LRNEFAVISNQRNYRDYPTIPVESTLGTANLLSDNVSVLVGNGAGGFSAPTNFVTGSGPFSITTGDFNKDGRLDLTTVNVTSTTVSVLLNTCVPYLPGDVDQRFGTGGVTTTVIGASSQANATVIQSDGKIVVAGTSSGNPDSGFALARYNADGSLDTTFGTGGKVFTAIGSTGQSYAVALQSDGKIVAAGFAGNGANNDFAIARYNTNGTLDTTFDNDGIVIVPIGAGRDEAYAVAVQTDGRIVVGGQSNNGTNDQIALVRLNNNGSLDNSFDGDGKVTTPVTSGSEYAFALRIQPDGKIVTGGVSGNPNIDFLIARFNTTGSLDTTFGTGGKVFTDFGGNDYVTALALSPEGRIVAAGYTNANSASDFAVARYNTDGSPDTSFDGDGKAVKVDASSRDEAFAVAVQPNGGILLGGSSTVNGNQDFSLVRFNFNGSLDKAFGTNGKTTTNVGQMEDVIRALAIQSDGNVIAAGYKQISGQAYNFAVARYALGIVSGCGYSVAPNGSNIGAGGGTGNFNVTSSGAGCAFTATSNSSFITITSGGNGTGSGAVSFTVAANSGAARTGTITVAGETYTITQASGCTFTLSPTGASLPGYTGTGSFNITGSAAGCAFTAASNNPFITVTSGASGTGSGTVSFTVASNLGAARTGTITAGGQAFTISQAALPTLTINNATLNEGNSGTTAFTFTISLSAASAQPVTVNYATANGTATAGEDYTAANGTLTFAAGEVNKTLTVLVNGDTVVEGNETFTVNLSNANNATIAIAQGIGTILNDDTGGSIQFSLSNYTVNENAGTAAITVTRTGGAASGVSVNYSTSNGTATAGQDYTAASGTLTFGADETSKTFTVSIINDSINEPNETVNLSLSNAVGGGTLGSPATAVLTIIDDDGGAPTLSINNVSANEGNSGTTAFNFTVSLLGASSQTVTVNYATANGTATAPVDYTAANGTLSFAPGETSKTVTVSVVGDTDVEPDETFTVNLTGAANAAIANAVGTGTIQNDDTCSYSISPTSMNANAGGNSGNIITVTTQAGCAYTAVSNDAFITINSGANGTGNGTVSFTAAANTGAARTGTILIAGQVFTVNQTAGTVAARKTLFDYDGDGKSDISLFRPSNRVWYILNSGNSSVSYNQFGLSTDKIVPADFDGDGKTDIAVYRPENGTWYIMKSSGGVQYVQFGLAEDYPMPADFDGDGKAEIAVYRPSSGLWFILNSDTQQYSLVQFGASEDKPVPADYNGDGKTEIAVYRPSLGIWFIYNSDSKQYTSTKFGISTDKPVPADYNGDGKTDIAVYRPNEGNWYIATQSGGYTVTQFGISTDLPTPADYDGDGKADISVYRPNEGNWYQLKSKDGFNIIRFGIDIDKPTPNAFVY